MRINEQDQHYLQKKNLDRIRNGDEIRAMVKLRCGNLKEGNKYILVSGRQCIFYCEGHRMIWNIIQRIVEKRKRELWSDKLYEEKGMILKKQARQVRIKIKWKENVI